MSRAKVHNLTRTGRQVSEDPDLETILANLSQEDLEELNEVVQTVPDLPPADRRALVRGETEAVANNIRDAKPDTATESDSLKGILSQRGASCEGELKKESRKQEYLRKRGLSQEGNDEKRGGIQRQASVCCDRETRVEDRNNRGPECSKEDRVGLSSRFRKQESRDNEVKEETREREKNEDGKLRERRENRESVSNKTKDIISKLQDKNQDSREKDKREDYRKSVDSKTKDIISKLREKSEKEVSKEKDRKEDVRTRGLVSKMVEKQSQGAEIKVEDRTKIEDKKPEEEDKEKAAVKPERLKSVEKVGAETKVDTDDKKDKRKDKEEEITIKAHEKEREKIIAEESKREQKKVNQREEKVETKGKDTNEDRKPNSGDKIGNCVADKNSNSKTKEEEEEDEDSSMFDELMEQVRSNDPSLLELNVNNSEVIKTTTLIQFAEALQNNSHIKTFALANCRADDHVAYAIAGALRANKTVTSINLDSNLLTSKGIISLIQALQHNSTLTELRFHNQRHICGGKTEMEMTKVLKENTTLLKLGYHFELAGPRMTMTNILSRNMDRQRQKRLQEQKAAQANGEKKGGTLEVPKTVGGSAGGSLRGSPKASPKPSPLPSPMPSPKLGAKGRGGAGGPPPPPPPPGCGPPPPPPPMLNVDSLKNSLTPVSQRKLDGKGDPAGGKNTRDQLLASIRSNNMKKLKQVPIPKWLQ
ncbi:uncharacterized protein lmod1b [Aplochiton taeniatus]